MGGDEPTRHRGESQPMAASTLELLPWKVPALPADDVIGKMVIKVRAVWKHKFFPHPGAALLDPVMAALVKSMSKMCGAGLWAGGARGAALWEYSNREAFSSTGHREMLPCGLQHSVREDKGWLIKQQMLSWWVCSSGLPSWAAVGLQLWGRVLEVRASLSVVVACTPSSPCGMGRHGWPHCSSSSGPTSPLTPFLWKQGWSVFSVCRVLWLRRPPGWELGEKEEVDEGTGGWERSSLAQWWVGGYSKTHTWCPRKQGRSFSTEVLVNCLFFSQVLLPKVFRKNKKQNNVA